MSWSEVAHWWLTELESDPSYEDIVTPLLVEVLDPSPGIYLDLGCGEGRLMRHLARIGVSAIGLDITEALVRLADRAIVAEVESCPFRPNSFDGAYAALVLEHLVGVVGVFAEAARVVRPGGVLAIVANHPMWTAPGSTPIEDSDGEVLWRPGAYHTPGAASVEVRDGTVTFYHRPMGDLLNAAADAGWTLDRMIEQPHHGFDGQAGIQRLIACRWRLLP